MVRRGRSGEGNEDRLSSKREEQTTNQRERKQEGKAVIYTISVEKAPRH